jgi:hypothetical protein
MSAHQAVLPIKTNSTVRQKGNWTGDRKQTTLWAIDGKDAQAPTENADTVHGTQKPVECMRRPMLNNSNKGDCVYEPFMGSGTTLIAAQTIGRISLGLGLELNPTYIDVAIRRWEEFTGQQALLIEAGEKNKSPEKASPSACDVAAAASQLVGKTFAEVENLRLASTVSQSDVADRTKAASRETPSTRSEDKPNPDPIPQPGNTSRRIKRSIPSAAAAASTGNIPENS